MLKQQKTTMLFRNTSLSLFFSGHVRYEPQRPRRQSIYKMVFRHRNTFTVLVLVIAVLIRGRKWIGARMPNIK